MMRLLKRGLASALHSSGLLGWRESRRRERVGLILTYHRVNDEGDPFFPSLPVAAFESQLDLVNSRYQVVPVEELVQWLRDGPPGPPRVALTIDDGYQDTHATVLPRLRARGLPATLFLATGPVEDGEFLWLDRLRALYKLTPAERVELPSHGLGPRPLTTPAERFAAMLEVRGRLKGVGAAELSEIMGALWDQLAGDSLEWAPRPLTWAQVREIHAGGVAIGGHTHRHPILSQVGRAEALREVATSMELVRDRVGHPPMGFAYPNGAEGDYGRETLDVLRELGIPWACTTVDGPAGPDSPPLELPRLHTAMDTPALFGWRLASLRQSPIGPAYPVS